MKERQQHIKAIEMEISIDQRNLIRRLLEQRFSIDELKSLSFDIGLDYESIPHDTKDQLSREITLLCMRQGKVYELLKALPIAYLDKNLLGLVKSVAPIDKKNNKGTDQYIRIVLADSWDSVRLGLHTFLSKDAVLRIVGEAQDINECTGLLSSLKPDIVVLDLKEMRPFEENAQSVLKSIKLASPNTRILMLTTITGIKSVSTVLQFGVAGYLVKDTDAFALISAIHCVYEGEYLLSPYIASLTTKYAELPASKWIGKEF